MTIIVILLKIADKLRQIVQLRFYMREMHTFVEGVILDLLIK